MRYSLFCSLIGAAVIGLFFCGCSTAEGDFVPKTETELAAMENLNKTAHEAFVQGNYDTASEILKKINTERTVSRPLYQLEELSVLLLNGKDEEAHELMKKLNDDFESLFNKELEEKAQSLWHGEINKVFKGDSYERSTFYALMALSFINRENYEDALRCVQNGLLADADSSEEKAVDDYPLLFYLGFFAASKMQNKDEAEYFLNAMNKALQLRKFEADKAAAKDNCFSALAGQDPNVLLVVWAGDPPTVVCTGDYKENRSIIRGNNAFNALAVAVDLEPVHFAPNNLGDVEFQATTRGGRLMDNILKDQATAKAVMKTSGNVLFVAGGVIFLAGVRSLGSLPVGVTLMGVGGGCFVAGGVVHLIGGMINPAADGRFWRNLPAQLYIIPLTLPVGKHQIMIQGFRNFDAAGIAMYNIDVKEKAGVSVIHLPMLSQGFTYDQAMRKCYEELCDQAVVKADADRLAKEIK